MTHDKPNGRDAWGEGCPGSIICVVHSLDFTLFVFLEQLTTWIVRRLDYSWHVSDDFSVGWRDGVMDGFLGPGRLLKANDTYHRT